MSTTGEDGFLARWARRKAQTSRGVALPDPPPAAPRASPGASVQDPPAGAAPAAAPDAQPLPAAEPAAPTMDDIAGLDASSDFSRFVGRGVDTRVSNAAMKRLFADPRFNVMDGLDTYIDDYNRAEPLPRATMRQMVQARVLGLLDDELEEQPLRGPAAPPAAQAPPARVVPLRDAEAPEALPPETLPPETPAG